MGPRDLRAISQPLQIVPASLLLLANQLAGPTLDPLAHLPGVPHPSIFGRLLQSLGQIHSLIGVEQRTIPGTGVSVTAVAQSLRSIGVVAASKLLYPAPTVSGDLHDLAGGLALAVISQRI